MPSLAGRDTALHFGLPAAEFGREVVATAPGASTTAAEEFVGSDDSSPRGSRAVNNRATLRRTSKWQFGACSDEPPAVGELVGSAMRFAKPFSVEFGFVRCSSRVTRRHPCAPLFAKVYPSSPTDSAWLLYRVFSRIQAPGHVAVKPDRHLQKRRCMEATGTCISSSRGPRRCVTYLSRGSSP